MSAADRSASSRLSATTANEAGSEECGEILAEEILPTERRDRGARCSRTGSTVTPPPASATVAGRSRVRGAADLRRNRKPSERPGRQSRPDARRAAEDGRYLRPLANPMFNPLEPLRKIAERSVALSSDHRLLRQDLERWRRTEPPRATAFALTLPRPASVPSRRGSSARAPRPGDPAERPFASATTRSSCCSARAKTARRRPCEVRTPRLSGPGSASPVEEIWQMQGLRRPGI